jgi:hypothetical protein
VVSAPSGYYKYASTSEGAVGKYQYLTGLNPGKW